MSRQAAEAMKSNNRSGAFEYDEVIDFDKVRKERREKRKEKLDKKKPVEKDALSRRKAAKRRRFMILCTAGVLFVAAVVVSAGINLWNLHLEQQETQAELDALMQKQAELKNELSQLDNEEYIEQEARSELHMIFPGEIMYVIPMEPIVVSDEVLPEESDAKPE
jgi:cell division protein FtsL